MIPLLNEHFFSQEFQWLRILQKRKLHWKIILALVHWVNYRNLTWFPDVEILWKWTVSSGFLGMSTSGNYVKLRYFMLRSIIITSFSLASEIEKLQKKICDRISKNYVKYATSIFKYDFHDQIFWCSFPNIVTKLGDPWTFLWERNLKIWSLVSSLSGSLFFQDSC